MKILKLLIIIAVLIVGGYFGYQKFGPSDEKQVVKSAYTFDTVQLRNLSNMVSSTGEVSAREIVEIGTQVSGTIDDVYVDYNDHVEADQLMAQIDPTVLNSQVRGAEADIMRAKSQLKKAQLDYERYEPVHEQGFLSDKDFLAYEVTLESAKATMIDAEANLERALRNRSYSEIKAPISGIVINRDVEKGQTVAASFNTPRLFVIAKDLRLMEIIANVDESDIGQVKVDQKVRYTVAAYPEDTMEGIVTQIRLLPVVIQNVVNYKVVIETENPDGKLLPGMTATVDFVVDEIQDALSVPVGALNLRPNEEMMEIMKKRRESMQKDRNPSERGERTPREGGFSASDREGPPQGGMRGGNGGDRRRNMVMLWFRNEAGALDFVPVRKGVSDGVYCEVKPIREAEALKVGLEVITKVSNPSDTAARTSPAQGAPGGGGLRRLGF